MIETRRSFLIKSAAAGTALAAKSNLLAELIHARGLPLKVGVTDWNLQQEGKPSAIEVARKIGLEGVEVSLGVGMDRLPLADPVLQRRYLEESVKQKITIASTCLNILHRNYLKSDPLGQRWLADSIPISKTLGAKVILLPFFGKGALSNRAEMDRVADILEEMAPAAEKAGVTLGVENTLSAEDNARILGRAKSKAVGIYYDVGNSTNGGFDVVKEIRWLGKDRICQFHFKDNPHYLGEGKVNFPAVVEAIAGIGYKGWVHLETDSPSKNIEADLARNLKFVRDLLAKA
jgi:sugar phosphate isomerase/epimerase